MLIINVAKDDTYRWSGLQIENEGTSQFLFDWNKDIEMFTHTCNNYLIIYKHHKHLDN